jgi:hypothetical protein
MQNQIARSKEQALVAFVRKKAEIDAMLARLQALSDDHFGYAPDDVTWDHVGTLGYYTELLKRVTDSAFHEGEHAAQRRRSPAPAPHGTSRRGSGS